MPGTLLNIFHILSLQSLPLLRTIILTTVTKSTSTHVILFCFQNFDIVDSLVLLNLEINKFFL